MFTKRCSRDSFAPCVCVFSEAPFAALCDGLEDIVVGVVRVSLCEASEKSVISRL